MATWASHYLGDILEYDGRVDVIAHQVNCFSIMGGGLALQIKNKWPKVFNAYADYIRNIVGESGDMKRLQLLGHCQLVQTDHCLVANLFGQYDIGGGRQTDYEALNKSLISLRDQMKTYGCLSVAFPVNLGCGLAGGNWGVVSNLIKGVFAGSGISVTLVEYSPKEPI